MKVHGPIVILGFMACGKTEVSRLVAKELNLSLIDLDEEITSIVGRSPAALIRAEGEQAFRQVETATLNTVLTKASTAVIALGGGAWIEKTNRELLAAHKATSVWLDTPFEICWRRIEASTDDRPLGPTKAQARELYQRRLPIYRLATIRIEVDNADAPRQIAARILANLP